jgi:hypothetical protein
MSFEEYEREVENAVSEFAARGYLVHRVDVDVPADVRARSRSVPSQAGEWQRLSPTASGSGCLGSVA